MACGGGEGVRLLNTKSINLDITLIIMGSQNFVQLITEIINEQCLTFKPSHLEKMLIHDISTIPGGGGGVGGEVMSLH